MPPNGGGVSHIPCPRTQETAREVGNAYPKGVTMNCRQCGLSFSPSKFNPRQQYCSEGCRRAARLAYKRSYDRAWRRRNPHYMKCYLKDYRGIPGLIEV